jgi:hypothetical protein
MEFVLSRVGFALPGLGASARLLRSGLLHLRDHVIPSHRNDYVPHLLGRRALAFFSVLLVSVKIFAIAALSFGAAIPAMSSSITADNIVQLTNQSRAGLNLSPLAPNSLLGRAAQAKAVDMLQNGYFSHNSPGGKTPWNFIEATGYNYIAAGENLAVNFTDAEDAARAWMNSPTHKANIVNAAYEEIGVGIATGDYQGHLATFVVQMFGTRAAQQIRLTNISTKVAAPVETQEKSAAVPVSGESGPAVLADATSGQQSEPLAIQNVTTVVKEGTLNITATVSNSAVKVLALFGHGGILLSPGQGGVWRGSIPLEKLTRQSLSLKLAAYNIEGAREVTKVASFGPSSAAGTAGHAAGTTQVSLLGKKIDPKSFEYKFYLMFVASLLGGIVLAIGIKRHVQHIGLLANSAFVVTLAMFLWGMG